MEANQVKVGNVYTAKITGKLAQVRINLILPASKGGGWEGINLKTNRTVRIKKAEDLKGPAKPTTNDKSSSKSAKTEKSKTAPAKVANTSEKPGTSQPVANEGQSKSMSMLDAAVRVMSEVEEQKLNCQQLIENMTAKGYWQKCKGKTPDRTLHSAINREIKTKQGDSRFKKAGRGMFALA